MQSHWNDRRTWDKLAHCLFSCALARIGFPLLTSNTTSPHSCATFWHLYVAMLTSNNAFVPDPDKHDILASNPMDWLWLRLGMCMCGWGDQQQKYYLLGTPIVWWGGTYTQPVRVYRAARHLPSSPTATPICIPVRSSVEVFVWHTKISIELRASSTYRARWLGTFSIFWEDWWFPALEMPPASAEPLLGGCNLNDVG